MSRKTKHHLSRRSFLKLAAVTGLLAGCRPNQILTPTATSAPVDPTATPVPEPTATPEPTPVLTLAPQRPAIMQIYPDVPSRVVHARHSAAWGGDDLNPTAMRELVDNAITALTGMADPSAAWGALFTPEDRIAIKVSTIRFSDFLTHPALVMAVTDALQETGVPAEQIVIYDRFTNELEQAGFTINPDGPGVRCQGSDLTFVPGYTLENRDIGFSTVLMGCNALINMPILKQNSTGGLSFAMKNHYGSFDTPSDFHPPRFDSAVVALNAMPELWDRTRLIIGDALHVIRGGGEYGWSSAEVGDSIMMSFDPIAHDTVGMNTLCDTIGDITDFVTSRATPWLQNGADAGLGTNDPANMELVELSL